jgi:hypothetical protein
MNEIMKFRYVSFIGKMEHGTTYFKQIRYLDKIINKPLKRELYQDSQDFFRKYRKKT